MRLIDRLSSPQRVVAVVALGLALAVAGSYLVSLGGGPRSGWYAYAPLASSLDAPGTGLPGWLRLIIWLALIAVWALASIRVLRPASGQAPTDRRPAVDD
jgi:heme/copper-type cytochrome/quinol oxidase subunit 1